MPKMRKLTEPTDDRRPTTDDRRPTTNGQQPTVGSHSPAAGGQLAIPLAPPEPAAPAPAAQASAPDAAPRVPPLPAWERGTGGEGGSGTGGEGQALPPGWVWASLGQLFRIHIGGTPSRQNPEYWNGNIPWVSSGEVSFSRIKQTSENITAVGLQNSNAKLNPPGTVLLAMIGEGKTRGQAAILDTHATNNQNVAAILCSETDIPSEWIFYWLMSNYENTRKSGSGGMQHALNTERVKALILPLPPLAEQRRIVEALEAQLTRIDAGAAALRAAQARLRRYRASLLKAACEGRLLPQDPADEPAEELLGRILDERRERWEAEQLARGKDPRRLRYEPPAPPDTDGLPELPRGWVVATLEQITHPIRVITYGILMPKENVSNGVLYVKVKDMKGDKIDISSLHRTSHEIAAEYIRASLKEGDILLAIRGTYGRVAKVPIELNGGNITQDTARIDITPHIDKDFIIIFLRSPDAQNYFKRVARGVAVKGVNIADVRAMPVSIPPLAEQRRIVAEVERRLSVLAETEAAVEANLRRAERLRQALLRRAFAGRLVPQDPSDEPAGALLERIREQRAENQEQRTKNRGPRAENREPRTKNKEPRAEGGASPARRRGRPPKQSGQLRLEEL